MKGTVKHADAQKLIAQLREHLPPLLPVRVYFRDLKAAGFLGTTTIMFTWDGAPKHFNIAVDKSLSWDLMRQTIMHEWAHALAWAQGRAILDHDPEWGLAMSRVYQEIIEP